MARISTYALDTIISNSDKLVGTDAENSENTKNYKIQDLIAFIAKNMPLPAFDDDAAAGSSNGMFDFFLFLFYFCFP